MNILGQPGYADATTASATYGKTDVDRGNIYADGLALGYAVEVVTPTHIVARNSKGLVAGEWDSRNGGMLAWSKQ